MPEPDATSPVDRATAAQETPDAGQAIDIVNDFDRFYLEQYPILYRTIRAIVLDAAVAEDLTQDTFAKAYVARHKYRPDRTPGVWLHRIGVNTAISHARRGGVYRRVMDRLGWTQMTAAPVDPTETRDPELRRALLALTPGKRASVVLHYYHGYSHAEISAILGIPVGTVGSRIFAALREMREVLQRPGEESSNPMR
jgi:RNA polymerase sigma-70 factor (ECF subfamily)